MMNDFKGDATEIEHLRAYAKALACNFNEATLHGFLTEGGNAPGALAALRLRLAAESKGDFLAFRLARRFAASAEDFRGPPLERQPLKPAHLM